MVSSEVNVLVKPAVFLAPVVLAGDWAVASTDGTAIVRRMVGGAGGAIKSRDAEIVACRAEGIAGAGAGVEAAGAGRVE